MPHISVSEAKTYRHCKKLHDYAYRQRIAPKRRAIALVRGNIGHDMLDAKALQELARAAGKPIPISPEKVLRVAEKKFNKLFAEEREQHGDLIGDLRRIMAGYWREYADQPLQILGTEEKVETDLGGGYTFIGYIDKRYYEPGKGLTWITDHKFKATIPDADDRFADFQLVSYAWAWNRENPRNKVDGVMWDYIRSKAPTIPEQLVRGGLTTRKNIDTDYFTYLSEIKRLGLDPNDYQEPLARLKTRPTRFFERVALPSPPKVMVDQVVKDLKTEAVLIHRLGSAQITRSMSYTCKRCDYFRLCQAELRGLDADFIRKTEFEPKEPHRGREEKIPSAE